MGMYDMGTVFRLNNERDQKVFDYDGYRITVRGGNVFVRADGDVRSVYKTDSLDRAVRWCDGYRNGEAWASADKLRY